MQLQYFKALNNSQSQLIFDAIESRHIVKVLRHKEGDMMHITNGHGLLVKGSITHAHPKHCTVQITDKQTFKKSRNYNLHIAIAPTKSIDRFEWFLEKATEIGIDRITPLLCEHSERKVIKHERLVKILIAAMKQSGQYFLPELDEMISFKDFINQDFDGNRCIAHCAPEDKKTLTSTLTAERYQILIGPEGDFSTTEIEQALTKDFIPVSLGDTRLRTETAGIVAVHTVNLKHTL